MQNVIVTGGAGYIGSHACKALATAGYQPVVYDNLARGFADAVKWGPLEQGDLLDRDRLDAVLSRYQPCAVMHFAALAYVAESTSAPGRYWRNNVAGSLNLLRVMQRHQTNKLVFSSSCAVYGESGASTIDERHNLDPVNPYGRTKLVVETMIRDSAAVGLINAVSLRYFNAAGADPDGELGERHHPETHLVPLVLEAAVSPQHPVTVFGDAHPTPDGTCIRDYVHVHDLAMAHVRALDFLGQNHGAHTFNLGNESGYSVYQVIEAVGRVTGRTPAFTVGAPRPGDPSRLIADARQAHDRLDWQPRYPGLDTMVESAWQWRLRQTR